MNRIELKNTIKKLLKEQRAIGGPFTKDFNQNITPIPRPDNGTCSPEQEETSRVITQVLGKLPLIPSPKEEPTFWDKLRHAIRHVTGNCDFPHNTEGPWTQYEI